MKILNLVQRSPEWFLYRSTRVGASEAAVVCGVSKYRTKKDLWEEKKMGKKKFVTDAMRYGTENESKVRYLMEILHDCRYTTPTIESDSPWLFASLDGFCEEKGKAIEIKNSYSKEGVKLNDIPLDWIYQCQAQMYAANLQEMSLVIFEDETPLEIPIKRDESIIREIIAKSKEFVEEWLKEEEIEGIAQERMDCAHLFNEASVLTSEIKKMEERLEQIKEELKLKANNAPIFYGPFKMTPYEIKGSINYKEIPELKCVDLETYRKKASVGWRLTV